MMHRITIHQLIRYGNGAMATYHTIPSVMEPYTVDLKIDDIPVKLTIWDSAGREEYDGCVLSDIQTILSLTASLLVTQWTRRLRWIV